jgi:hypothetical protein
MTEKTLFFAQIYWKDELEALGNRNAMPGFEKHIPDLIPVADMLIKVLGGSSRIIRISAKGSITTFVTEWFQNRPKHSKMVGKANVLNCLAGRSEIHIHQGQAKRQSFIPKIEAGMFGAEYKAGQQQSEKLFWYFIQPLPLSVDFLTGEIDDSAAVGYLENAQKRGYSAFLYRESGGSLACIVNFRSLLNHRETLNLATILASEERANVTLCSLFRSVRMPLSTVFGGEYCGVWNGDDFVTLKSFLNPDSQQPTENDGLKDRDVDRAIATNDDSDLFDEPEADTARFFFKDFVVERSDREELISELNTTDPVVLKLIGLYLLGTFTDKEDRTFRVCDVDQMMHITGEKQRKKDNISKHLNLLKTYLNVEVRESTRHTATSFKIVPSPAMKKIQESPTKILKDPVWLGNGKGLSDIKKTIRQERLDKVAESTTLYPNSFSLKLIQYLNNLPTNGFQSIVNQKLDEMIDSALSLNIESRSKTLALLHDIAIFPAPIYRVTESTSRVSAIGNSFQILKSSIRNIGFQGCLMADLSHFQLSVFSMLCRAEKMNKVLETEDGWNILCAETDLPKHILKPVIIKGIYHKQANVTSLTPFTDIDPILIRKAMDSEAIREFFEARYSFILSNFNNNHQDLFGNELKGELTQKLHVIASSYELSILEPGISYLTNLKDEKTKLLLWLHDGYVFKCRDSKANGICEKIKILTHEQCYKFNIKSSLIIKDIIIDS